MALNFFEEKRSRSLRRMEQDVVDSIMLLRGEALEERDEEGYCNEEESKKRNQAPSPLDNWLQDATPRAGLPSDEAKHPGAKGDEEDKEDLNSNPSRKASRSNSKNAKFNPTSHQVDIFLGGYMRGRQKERAMAAEEKRSSSTGAPHRSLATQKSSLSSRMNRRSHQV